METPSANPYETPATANDLSTPPFSDQSFRNMKMLAWIASASIALHIPYAVYIILLSRGVMSPDDDIVTLLDSAFLLNFIIGVIIYCVWKYRCARNASYFYGGPLIYTAGWCVGYYFIPILLWFRPYQCMKDIYEKTYLMYGLKAPTGALLIWWLPWVFGNLADNIATRVQTPVVFTISGVFSIVSASMCIWVIMTLTRRQYEIVNDPELAAKIGTINPYQGALPGAVGVPMQRATLPPKQDNGSTD